MTTNVPLPQTLSEHFKGFHAWHASRPITKTIAVLFLAKQIANRMNEPWGEHEKLRGQTKAVFDNFIENGRPRYGLFEESGGRTGIAQMKVMAPAPGIRLFGAFVHTSCFVGLRLFYRDELPFKPTGRKGIIDYKTLNSELIQEWVTLLPNVARMRIKDL